VGACHGQDLTVAIDSKHQSNKFLATSVTKKLDHYSNENLFIIGTDSCNCSIGVKMDSGQVVLCDWENEEEFVLADSLTEFFSKLKLRM